MLRKRGGEEREGDIKWLDCQEFAKVHVKVISEAYEAMFDSKT